MSKTFHFGTRYSRYLVNGKASQINDIDAAREAKRARRADPSCSYLLGSIDPADGERTFEPDGETARKVRTFLNRFYPEG